MEESWLCPCVLTAFQIKCCREQACPSAVIAGCKRGAVLPCTNGISLFGHFNAVLLLNNVALVLHAGPLNSLHSHLRC